MRRQEVSNEDKVWGWVSDKLSRKMKEWKSQE